MRNKIIALILMAFLISGTTAGQAETTPASSKTDASAPTNMSAAALASYIAGKLEPMLKDTGPAVSTDVCDSSGCAVVVQP